MNGLTVIRKQVTVPAARGVDSGYAQLFAKLFAQVPVKERAEILDTLEAFAMAE